MFYDVKANVAKKSDTSQFRTTFLSNASGELVQTTMNADKKA